MMFFSKRFNKLIYRLWGISFILFAQEFISESICPGQKTYLMITLTNPLNLINYSDNGLFYEIMFKIMKGHVALVTEYTIILAYLHNIAMSILFIDLYLIIKSPFYPS